MSEAPQHKIEEWIIQFVAANPTPPECVRQKNVFISTALRPSKAVSIYASKWQGYLQAKTEMFLGDLKNKTNPIDDDADPTTRTVYKIIREQLGLRANHEISRSTNLVEDLGADSLDLVELVMCIEDEFRIELKDTELDRHTGTGKIYIVGNFLDIVKSATTEK